MVLIDSQAPITSNSVRGGGINGGGQGLPYSTAQTPYDGGKKGHTTQSSGTHTF